MRWSEVLEEHSLHDLQYRIETNRDGQIVMNPASNRHSLIQGSIVGMLYTMRASGRVLSECAVETAEGVKIADASWASVEFLKTHRKRITYAVAPELCVEVQSPSNTMQELLGKKALYFQRGAREVWICDSNGDLTFYGAQGEIERSEFFPDFPKHVDPDFD